MREEVHEKMLNITNHQGNANQNHIELSPPSHLSESQLSKRPEITGVGADVEKRKPLCTIGKNVNWCNHHEKQYGGSSKNYK